MFKRDPKQANKLTTGKKNILRLVLAAYVLIAMGLFSWLPLFLFDANDKHQVTIEDAGYMVIWKMHQLDDGVNKDKLELLQQHSNSHLKNVKSTEPDHEVDVPSDEFIKYVLKIATQVEPLLLFSSILLFCTFLALLKYKKPKLIGHKIVFAIPIRNSFEVLTRTVVLRH